MPSADKQISPPQIVLKEIDGSHYYWVDGEYLPSVTHILGIAAPTGDGLKKFFLNNTQESVDKILEETSTFGTLIHESISWLLNGNKLDLMKKDEHGKYVFNDRHKRYLMDFQHWFSEFKPTDIKSELMVASKEMKYAGTLDLICKIGDKRVIVDFKTSSAIHYNHELQITAYKKAYEEIYKDLVDQSYILRLGAKTKQGYEFKEVVRTFPEFVNVYNTFVSLNGGKLPAPPTVKSYPAILSLYEEVST